MGEGPCRLGPSVFPVKIKKLMRTLDFCMKIGLNDRERDPAIRGGRRLWKLAAGKGKKPWQMKS